MEVSETLYSQECFTQETNAVIVDFINDFEQKKTLGMSRQGAGAGRQPTTQQARHSS